MSELFGQIKIASSNENRYGRKKGCDAHVSQPFHKTPCLGSCRGDVWCHRCLKNIPKVLLLKASIGGVVAETGIEPVAFGL